MRIVMFLTLFLGKVRFSLRPCRASLMGAAVAEQLVSICSAFSMSKASNFSMTRERLRETRKKKKQERILKNQRREAKEMIL